MSFRTLIRIICSQYTVVLLLDDLQWASDDCVKLVKAILTDPQASNLLLLTTHRELGPSSPAFHLKNDIPSHILTRIRLGNLSPMDICDVVESLLGGRDAEEEDIQGLAILIHSKTGGTIFVVVQFLRMLYKRELITYSFHRLRWEFSLDRISNETSIYGNVLQMVCDKISKLPKPLQVPMTTAAFLGFSSFDVALLYHVLKGSPIYPAVDDIGFQMILEDDVDSLASGMSLLGAEGVDHHDPIDHYMDTIQDADELRAILQLAVKEGLLEKIPPRPGDNQQLLLITRGDCYRFSHDRVREGALALISQHQLELQTMHLQMGLELRRIREDNILGGDEEELERLLLHAVRHLNEGMSMTNASAERVELSRMNLEAAIVVIERSAFPSALEFLQTGLGLLDEETKWTENYDLTLQLSDKVTQVRFCTGQHEENWKTLYDVLEHGRSTNDKLNAYRTLILSLATEGRFDEAIATNLAVLEKLGVSLPRNFIKVHMAQALSKLRRRTKGRTEEEVFVYRDNVDEIARFQCEFLGTLVETCRLSGHDDYRVLGMVRATDYIIDNGIEELAPMAMIGCAYQYGLLGEVDKSYRFGKLAAKIAMEGKNPRNDGKAIALAYECPIALKEPYHKCLDSLLTAFKFILDNGEIEHLYLPMIGTLGSV
jgi:predicted ATPase